MRSRSQTLFYGDDLAELHNRHYSDVVSSAAPQVIRMLRANGIKSGVVCDVGCGGGQLSASLLKAGYPAVGIDISSAMVALARKQVPGGTFITGSIVEAAIPACAAAVAVGEVFNYLGSPTAMIRAFRNLFRSLRPGGILIFDIKEPPSQKLSRVAGRIGADWAVLAEIEEDPARKKLIRRITSFRKSGRYYHRQTEIHEARIYPAEDVKEMLQSLGFRVRIYQGYGDYRLAADHKVLLATKPKR